MDYTNMDTELKFYVDVMYHQNVISSVPFHNREVFDTLKEAKSFVQTLLKAFDNVDYTIYQGFVLERKYIRKE